MQSWCNHLMIYTFPFTFVACLMVVTISFTLYIIYIMRERERERNKRVGFKGMAFGSGVSSQKKALNGSKKDIPTNPNFLLANKENWGMIGSQHVGRMNSMQLLLSGGLIIRIIYLFFILINFHSSLILMCFLILLNLSFFILN